MNMCMDALYPTFFVDVSEKGMPNGRLYDREGMAMMGRQSLSRDTFWVKSLLDAICVCPRYL
jgi:hypothetical protein